MSGSCVLLSPKSIANIFFRDRKDGQIQFMLGWAPDPAWAGVVLGPWSFHSPPPLNNTILPPKIKLYLYLYNTPPQPPQPSPPAVPGSMLQTRDGTRSLVVGEQLMGRGHTPAPCVVPGDQRRGRGENGAGVGGSNRHTTTHSEAWLFGKGCSGTPWHSAGRPGLCNTAGRTQTLGRGHPMPTPILGATTRAARRSQVVRRGPWGTWVSPSPGSWGRAGEGKPSWQGQAGRARPS